MQEKIVKYQTVLQELVDTAKKNNGYIPSKQLNAIISDNKIATNVMADAVSIGILERTGRALYKANITKIEPIHARKVLEYRRAKTRVGSKISIKQKNSKEFKQEDKKTLSKKKSISFLWGLIIIKL